VAALTSDVLNNHARRNIVTPAIVVWALLAAAVAVFWPTVRAVVGTWMTVADYEHGWAIAAIAAFWLLRQRARIDAAHIRPQPLALIALAALLFAWMVAWRANSDILQQLIAPLAVLATVLAALGPAALRLVLGPIAFLYFAIPLWDHLVPALQGLTVWVTEGLLGLIGVPAQVEGHHVQIPAGMFSIIEGCSGKRYFVIGLAVGALAAAFQGLRGRKLTALMAVAALAALVTNWLRVVTVIYAGHVSDMQHYLVAVEHKTLGYFMFAPMLLVIGWVARRLGVRQASAPSPAESCAESLPVSSRTLLSSAAPALALLVIPAVLSASGPAMQEDGAALRQLPLLTGKWQGPLPANERWRPRYTGPADERRVSYAADQFRVEVYLNSYAVQSPGRELVHHSNSTAPADRWMLVKRLPADETPLRGVIVESRLDGRWLVAQTHVVGGRVIAAPALAQLYYGLDAVWRAPPAGIIALAAPCAGECDAAAQRVRELWADHSAAFIDVIPR
jgi:EpsI family protein